MELAARTVSSSDVALTSALADIGCGDGRIVVMAVEEFGARKAVGIEIDRHLVATATQKAHASPLSDRISILLDDCRRVSYADATVVCVYMGVTGNAEMRALLASLPEHVRIVSHSYTFDGWTPAASSTGTHQVPTADGASESYESEFAVYLYHGQGVARC